MSARFSSLAHSYLEHRRVLGWPGHSAMRASMANLGIEAAACFRGPYWTSTSRRYILARPGKPSVLIPRRTVRAVLGAGRELVQGLF